MKRLFALSLAFSFSLTLLWAQDSPAPALIFADEVPKDVSELKVLQKKIRRVIRRNQAATVKVAGGSGVVVDPDGIVLTVGHLTRSAGRSLTVTFSDGRKVTGKSLGANLDRDAALVQLDEPGPYPFARMGDSESLEEGQWCVAMGYPMSFEAGKAPHVRVGRVLHNYKHLIMSDCVIMGGDSGGPLYDLAGRVIGISSRCDRSLLKNFHVPVHLFQRDWDSMVAKEVWSSTGPNGPFFGVGPSEDTDDAVVGRIVEDSGAAEAGIEVGDRILEFGGKEVENYHQLVHLIRDTRPNNEVEVKVKRGDETLDLKVTIGKRGDH